MKCPLCNTEARILTSSNVFKQEEMKLYHHFTFACRNSKCDKFDKEIGEDDVPLDVEIK